MRFLNSPNRIVPFFIMTLMGLGQTQVRITLRPIASLSELQITLGAIADIQGPSPLRENVSAMVIGPAAGFGLSRRLDGGHIAQQILEQFGEKVVLVNPDLFLSVTSNADTLAAAVLDSLRDAAIAASFKDPSLESETEWVKTPPGISLPRFKHQLIMEIEGVRNRGKVALSLKVMRDGSCLRRYPLMASVQVQGEVAVASRRLQRGEALGIGNIKWEKRDITSFHPDGLILRNMEDLEAKVSIPEGRILTRILVASRPLVHKGETAQMSVRNGSVAVSVEVLCRQDGALNDFITVRHPGKMGLMRAKVVGDKQVMPIPEG